MSQKTIRIWDGSRVLGILSVNQRGGASFIGAVGGAGNSTPVDIEIDPFGNLLVDRAMPGPPVAWREVEVR